MKITLFLAALLFVALSTDFAAARFRFRIRTVRTVRTYRGGSTFRSSFRPVVYPSYSRAFAAGILVHGITRYRLRVGYKSDPSVCYTSLSGRADNGTRVSKLGYFVCPFNSDSVDKIYCCGPADKQKCCGFWGDSGRAAGTIIGLVIAFIIFVTIICCAIKCCINKSKETKAATQVVFRPTGGVVQFDSGVKPYPVQSLPDHTIPKY